MLLQHCCAMAASCILSSVKDKMLAIRNAAGLLAGVVATAAAAVFTVLFTMQCYRQVGPL